MNRLLQLAIAALVFLALDRLDRKDKRKGKRIQATHRKESGNV